MTFPDGTKALGGVTFDINPGEFITVVGPSGCGKSTLLRIASNLETETEGKCEVDRNSIGYVFQDATLLPWRNVRKNIEIIAELHGIEKSQRAKLAQDAINLVGLTSVDICEKKINLAYLTNTRTVENLVHWISDSRANCHLVQISTDHVYDSDDLHTEDMITIKNNYDAIWFVIT